MNMRYCGLFHLDNYYSSELIDFYDQLTNGLILIVEGKKRMIKMTRSKRKRKKRKNRKQN